MATSITVGSKRFRKHVYSVASFHETNVNPFGKYQWVSRPMLKKNMPTEHPLATPHISQNAIVSIDSCANDSVWHVIDAKGKKIGSVAHRVARILRGKHRVDFKPNYAGDSVIVVNAIHAEFPGHTWDTKVYKHTRHSNSMGNKIITAKYAFFNNPSTPLNRAVLGMLPKTNVRNVMMRKLFVYPGAIHPHYNIPQVVIPRAESRPDGKSDKTREDSMTALANKCFTLARVEKSRSRKNVLA